MAKIDPRLTEIETQEWLESLDDVARNEGAQRVKDLLEQLRKRALGH